MAEARRRSLMENTEYYQPHAMKPQRPPVDSYGALRYWPVFSKFNNRAECNQAGIHRANFAGIVPGPLGAYSICVSGQYMDSDKGETLTYTGTGGQADSFQNSSGQQEEDQSLDHEHNKSLVRSIETGKPVRVIRGSNLKSKYAPGDGYRYDGLYKVVSWNETKSPNEYKVYTFDLERIPNQPAIPVRSR